MIEYEIEVFMDDFSDFGDIYDECLQALDWVLQRCETANLVLNSEKCHFIVQQGIVLGHKISSKGLEVDRAKIENIERLSPLTTVKGVKCFIEHAWFYGWFITDFWNIAKLLCNLLEKDATFKFHDPWLQAFEELKSKLTSTPIVTTLVWSIPFELIFDASEYAIGIVLG